MTTNLKSLRFFPSNQVIQQTFGLDISLFNQQMFYLILLSIGFYMMILAIPVLYAYQDIHNNELNTLTMSLQSSLLRGCLYYFGLLSLTFSAGFFSSLRKAQKHNNKRVDLLIMNIPQNTSEDQIIKSVEHISGNYTIKTILKIVNPKSYNLQEDLYLREKEFYDRIKQDGANKMKEQQGKFWKKMKLTKFVQYFGFYRDYDYYKSQITQLNLKIKISALDQLEEEDAAIVTFKEFNPAQKILKKSKGIFGFKIQSSRVRVLFAPHPNDIIYANLGVNNKVRFGKQVLTFLIVIIISFVNFLILCWMRQLERNLQDKQLSFAGGYFVYIGIFVVMMLLDLIFRPVLYWANYFEQHVSYGEKERSWMVRLFIYSLLNKLSMIFSRNFVALLNLKNKGSDYLKGLAQVFQYTTIWRRGSDTGGSDLISFMWVCIIMYPILEFLAPILYKLCQYSAATTQYDKEIARNGTDIRFTSVWTSVLVVFCTVFSFASVQPEIILMFALFCCIYGVSLKVIQRYLCKRPFQINGVAQTSEIVIIFSILIAVFFLSITYDNWAVWFACGIIFVIFTYIGSLFIFQSVIIPYVNSTEAFLEEESKLYQLPKPFYSILEKQQIESASDPYYTTPRNLQSSFI
ncbi:Transmembrane domain-containing protein [Spironucleus salmonicida]|nr:Transmembrane domain-containing protein [Spironucleus salmonicida]